MRESPVSRSQCRDCGSFPIQIPVTEDDPVLRNSRFGTGDKRGGDLAFSFGNFPSVVEAPEQEGNGYRRCVISGFNQGTVTFGDIPPVHFQREALGQGLLCTSIGPPGSNLYKKVWDILGPSQEAQNTYKRGYTGSTGSIVPAQQSILGHN